MGLFSWYIGKRNSIVNDILSKKNKLSSEWNNFLKRKTYLTGDIKKNFKRSFLPSFHWFFLISHKIRKSSSEYIEISKQIKEDKEKYNPLFVARRLKESKKLFDEQGLDDLQRRAIVIDEKHNLVIAGAGAGKTKVLTSKINYLLKRPDKPEIKPEKMLVLAFNNLAVKEIRDRMDEFNVKDVTINTFHKLGKDIIHNETNQPPHLIGDTANGNIPSFLKDIFKELLEKEKYQEMVIEYLSNYIDEDVTFEEKEKEYHYLREKRYTTLKNEKVKSNAEREIANFLFTHNIDYEYEREIDWIKDNKQKYCPDFYLPKYDIYIEHWGLDENNKVPEWFEGENPTEKYLKDKEWKLKQFEKYKKKLIESFDYDRNKGILIRNLIKNLRENIEEIELKRLSYKEIVEKSHSFREKPQELIEMIYSFINIAKSNGLSPSEIKERIQSKEYSERQKLFGKMALEVFINYEKFLKENKKIDFNDMMIKATKEILKNKNHYRDKYDYILIDEFQDISRPRLDIIQALLKCNPNIKLFCVGDDWQSINGFAGSNLNYFINFKDNFEFCEEIPLKTNYRSSKMVVEMSNKLISMNKNRTKKEIVHCEKNGKGYKAKLYILSESSIKDEGYRIERAIDLIRSLIDQNVKIDEILVLSRFNRILRNLKIKCHNNTPKIPIEEDGKKGIKVLSVHRSKGIEANHVIILDVVSGTYGFPSEIRDLSVLEIARKDRNKNNFEEERRLFYVALTRSRNFLYLFTIKDNQSIFLKEIRSFTERIFDNA